MSIIEGFRLPSSKERKKEVRRRSVATNNNNNNNNNDDDRVFRLGDRSNRSEAVESGRCLDTSGTNGW